MRVKIKRKKRRRKIENKMQIRALKKRVSQLKIIQKSKQIRA